MEGSPERAAWFIHAFWTMLPYAILFGVWLYFMKKFTGRSSWGGLVERQREHMDRVEAQLERIAVALERSACENEQDLATKKLRSDT